MPRLSHNKIIIAMIIFAFAIGMIVGHWAVLNKDRLLAQEAVIFKIVYTAPSTDHPMSDVFVNAATAVCKERTPYNHHTCMNNFLRQYMDAYIVNTLDGTYERLGDYE